MLSKSKIALYALAVLSTSQPALGREKWLERDNKAVFLHPRRFGQEQPAVIQKLSGACPGQVCGVLAGGAVTPLLAAQPECTQQDHADAIIDAAAQFDAATRDLLISLAIEYRQVEKNTPPDFSTNPPTPRNSVFCQKAPKNAQLNGLVQAQDPANGDVFFDPATKASVQRGSQANTAPFGGAAAAPAASSAAATSATESTTEAPAATGEVLIGTEDCVSTVTVTVTGDAAASATDAVTVSVGATSTSEAASAATTTAAAASGAIGDFGKCTVPQIEFGVGFDNRKETSFQPVDRTSFGHGSAQAIGIITQFICDTLTNSCGADATAKATCAKAITAANTGAAKTGVQADLFNAVFGIKTNFAAVASIDDQGRVVSGTGNAAATTAAAAASTTAAAATTVASSTSAAAAAATTSAAAAGNGNAAIGNFGSCSVPQIEFAAGFDGRKETSFEPVDLKSFAHTSAQNFAIISQFVCDTLVNSCGADATAKATCATAKAAGDAGTAKTGVQADLFNAAFGIKTNFAAVAVIDNQGNVVQAGTGAAAASSSVAAAPAASTTAAAAPAATTVAATAGNLQTFTAALGGVTPPAVTALGNGQFQVDGNSAFNALQNALIRSCDVQHNKCANAANASGNKGDLTVSACGDQQTQCNAAAQA